MSKGTYLVTGGAGFIGSHFVELLLQKGHRVIVLDALTYAGHRENLEDLTGTGSFELVVGDICNQTLVSELFLSQPFDGIFNFAAESHVDRSITGPMPFIETNIKGVVTLLLAALEHWKKLSDEKKNSFRYLQISTDEVYGSLGSNGKFSEATPMAPNSPYSASKAAGDLLVRAWHHTYGLPTITTNCTNNYGPRQFPEKLIPYLLHCALEGKPMPVYGDGLNVRDWIQVQDHCEGIWLAFSQGAPGETYCFGGDAERTNIDVVREMCKILDELKPKNESYLNQIQYVKDRPGHDRRYAIDDSKAQRELNFRRKYTFETGLRATLRWYLDNALWCKKVLRKDL